MLQRYGKAMLSFSQDVIRSRHLIWTLAKNDFRSRYLGSYLGLVWAFIQPIVNILVLWFIFEVGFRVKPVNDYPYILWLMAGMIPWFFLSEVIMSGTASVVDQSFLVKKVVFRVSILPVVKIVSALFVHGFFLLMMFAVFWLYGYPPTLQMFGVLYYLGAAICLVLGLTWLTSALCVFTRDVTQVVGILIQLLFWVTPIFWEVSIAPARFQWLLKLNPVYYIIGGYRSCFIQSPPPSLVFGAYYWGFTIVAIGVGAIVFKRLRKHFADVL